MNYVDCPAHDRNLGGRVGSKTTRNVLSWAACSKLCSQRSDCKNWVWHHGNAGRWAYQCVTMTGFGSSRRDRNTVSGSKGCVENGKDPNEVL